MEQHLIDDLQTIFENRLAPDLMARLVENFDLALNSYSNIFRLNTRKDGSNELLSWQGQTYFSLVQISKTSPVVVAGALERNLKGEIVPAIRFRDDNISLRDVPAQYKFPYRKPSWTYVEIQKETMTFFPHLLETQVRIYIQH